MSIRILRRGVTVLTLGTLAMGVVADDRPSLPESPREVVIDEYHGVKIEDPYRWLEGSVGGEYEESIAQSLDEKVSDWMDAQNAYTRAVLDNLPGRAELEARIAELMTVDSIGAPSAYGSRYFNRERRGDENQSILYVRDHLDSEPRVLIDPNALDEKGLISLDWYRPTHDGSLMAFGLSYAGSEKSTLHLMNVDSGEWLADEIPGDVSGVSWLPDASAFLYHDKEDPNDPYSTRIRFHEVGRHHRQDPTLFRQDSTTWGPGAWLSRDGRWMMLMDWTGTNKNDLFVVDFDRWRRSGEFDPIPIAEGLEATFSGSVYGDTLYMETTLDAPNRMVYAVDLNRPARENWKVVIPERDDAVLSGVSTARGMLVASYEEKAHTVIERFTLDGESLGVVDLPGIGSAGITTSDDRTEAFLSYSSFNEPRGVYRIELESNERSLWARPGIPVDPSIVEVKQVTYESKDGTPVTMFIVHRKGLELDGSNPTIMSGYGGFNISMTPYFSSTMFPWYERGGVFAMPNLRGGGEYGEAWHRAGMLENKQNVFDDFIAAAEWLIDEGYTNPDRLVVSGGSNGGLLTGAAVTQRPDLFSGVISAVPLLDMLRYEKFLMARYWVPEYGTAEDADQFAFLNAYSPYQRVEEGVKYPATLLTAGENDSRVHPLHARKMAAAMQAATASDFDDEPILLWIDREAGHGSGKPLSATIREVTDSRIFAMWQTGMLKE
ncbi:MAG: prolyl oligopeptidase family protein [Phycisphaerales bacterium]